MFLIGEENQEKYTNDDISVVFAIGKICLYFTIINNIFFSFYNIILANLNPLKDNSGSMSTTYEVEGNENNLNYGITKEEYDKLK